MKPIDLASATGPATRTVPSHFMVEGATYERGAELGFQGADFYTGGRGGVLGDVHGDVVAAAFVFFEPGHVREGWDRAGAVTDRATAAAEFAACGYQWARHHLTGEDLDVVAELGTKVVQAANPALAPIFAAWRALPVPTDRAAAAFHQLNALRELRNAMHGAAILTAGLSSVEAVAVRAPEMAALFGWQELPQAGELEPRWAKAEVATDIAMAHVLSVLSDDEGEAFAWPVPSCSRSRNRSR